MNFSELVAEVVSATSRPDLGLVSQGGDGQIPRYTFASIMNAHLTDYYWRDISTADVIFDAAAYIQELDIQTIPRFRAFSYFRKWDPSFSSSQSNPLILPPLYSNNSTVSGVLALDFIKIITPDAIFDDYGTEKLDVGYAAGSTFFIKSSTLLAQAKIGYYSYPFLDQSNEGAALQSWIAEDQPYAIIFPAIAMTFTNTGDEDAARQIMKPANYRTNDPGGPGIMALEDLRRTAIEVVGR